MTKILTLPLKACYFDEIKAGRKPFEYRLCTPYWEKRLAKDPFHQVMLTKGYPKADDTGRRLLLPWRGFERITLKHEHFGPEPVEVFAIFVGPATQEGNKP